MLSLFALLILGGATMAQSETNKSNSVKPDPAKMIVMINTATWCPTCQAHGRRVETNVVSKYVENSRVQIVVNDLTNDATKSASLEKCKALGIASVAQNSKGTGVIYFIHSKTGKVMDKISVSKSDDEIHKAFSSALSLL